MATHTAAWLGMFTARADAAFEQIAAQTRELLFDREHLERALAALGDAMAGLEEVLAQAGEAVSVLEDASPEQAVEAGRGQYDEWRATAPDEAWEVTGRDRFPRAPWLEDSSG